MRCVWVHVVYLSAILLIVNSIEHYSSTLNHSQYHQNGGLLLKTPDVQAKTPSHKLTLSSRAKAAISEGRLFSGMRRRLKPMIVTLGKSALRRSWIKSSVLALLNLTPELKTRLYRIVWKDITLSPRAMRIYTTLSTAIPTHSKGTD
jgi:hypothetical protein